MAEQDAVLASVVRLPFELAYDHLQQAHHPLPDAAHAQCLVVAAARCGGLQLQQPSSGGQDSTAGPAEPQTIATTSYSNTSSYRWQLVELDGRDHGSSSHIVACIDTLAALLPHIHLHVLCCCATPLVGWMKVELQLWLPPSFFFRQPPSAASNSSDAGSDASSSGNGGMADEQRAVYAALPPLKAVNELVRLLAAQHRHQQQQNSSLQVAQDAMQMHEHAAAQQQAQGEHDTQQQEQQQQEEQLQVEDEPQEEEEQREGHSEQDDDERPLRPDIRDEIFALVDPSGWRPEAPQPPGLAAGTRLYHYQRRALAWALWREEGAPFTDDDGEDLQQQQQKQQQGEQKPGADQQQGKVHDQHHSQQQRLGGSGLHGSTSNSQGVKRRRADQFSEQQHQGEAVSPWAVSLGDLPPHRMGHGQLNPLWRTVTLPGSSSGSSCCSCSKQNPAEHASGSACSAISKCTCGGSPGKSTLVYHCPLYGLVSLQRPPPLPQVRGGCLCDEMGLGKTLEVIGLMLSRPPPHRSPVGSGAAGPSGAAGAAGHDAAVGHPPPAKKAKKGAAKEEAKGSAKEDSTKQDQVEVRVVAGDGIAAPAQQPTGMETEAVPVVQLPGGPYPAPGKAAGATLVITPPALLQQWVNELAHHAPCLKVKIFEGLNWHHTQATKSDRSRKHSSAMFRRAAEVDYAVNGPPSEPAYDYVAQAAEAVRNLQDADVVLTTYSVLQAEVHYVPEQAARTLRRPKKYKVPESPLTQMHWWRVVVDEAQMVGPTSNAGIMAARLTSCHIWAVTGTPIGAGGISDVGGLLKVLQLAPLDDAATFRAAVRDPVAAGAPGARGLLRALLQPLMWRNTKAAAAHEHPLPPRRLHVALLRFSPAEQEFYASVLEATAKVHTELEALKQQLQQLRQSEQQARGRSGARDSRAAVEKQRRAVADAERSVVHQLLQLRRACIHPQMTSYWQKLGAELQLAQGGALTINDILGRMRDEAQLKLQAAERDLCDTLNALAATLLQRAVQLEAPVDARKEGQQEQQQGEEGGEVSPGSAAAGKKRRAGHGKKASRSKRARMQQAGGVEAGAQAQGPAAGAGAVAAGGPHSMALTADDAGATAGGSAVGHPGAVASTSGAAAAPGAAASPSKAAGGNDDGDALAWLFAAVNDPKGKGPAADATKAAATSAATASGAGSSGEAHAAKLRWEAVQLLEAAYRVGEHGIQALRGAGVDGGVGAGGAAGADVPDTIVGASTSIRAWRFTQVYTAQMLVNAYTTAGCSSAAAAMAREVAKKSSDLTEGPEAEAAKAESRLEGLKAQVAAKEAELHAAWAAAAAAGLPLMLLRGCKEHSTINTGTGTGINGAEASSDGGGGGGGESSAVGDAGSWLAAVKQQLEAAKAAEAAERRTKEFRSGGEQTVLLGKEVEALMSAIEGAASAELRAVEGVGVAMHAREALQVVRAAQKALGSGRSVHGSGSGSSNGIGDAGARFGAAARHMFLDCLPERRMLWIALMRGGSSTGNNSNSSSSSSRNSSCHSSYSDGSAAPAAAAGAHAGALLVQYAAGAGGLEGAAARDGAAALLRRLAGLLQKREEGALLAGREVAPVLQPLGAEAVSIGADLMRCRLELLRLMHSTHIAELAVEVAVHEQQAAVEEVGEAAAGRLPAMCALADKLCGELRGEARAHRVKCEELASRKRFLASKVQEHEQGEAAAIAAEVLQRQRQQQQAPQPQQQLLAPQRDEQQQHEQEQQHASWQQQGQPRPGQAAANKLAAPEVDNAQQRNCLCLPSSSDDQADVPLATRLQQATTKHAHGSGSAGTDVDDIPLGMRQHLHRQCVHHEQRAQQNPQHGRQDHGLLRPAPSNPPQLHQQHQQQQGHLTQSPAGPSSMQLVDLTGDGSAAAALPSSRQSSAMAVDDDHGDDGHDDGVGAGPECPICKEKIKNKALVLACAHTFCEPCLQSSLAAQSLCPVCRSKVTPASTFAVSIAPRGGHTGGAGHVPEVDPPEGPELMKVKVPGQFMTKLEGLVRRLLHLSRTSPGEKALVFSQFPEALRLVGKALDVAKLRHVSLDGGGGRMAVRAAVRAFEEDEGVRVFLLSLRTGAAGLTLVRANHVFLLEPALDPAIEQQAVARVHRIGQTRPVTITRLIISDTVETLVMALLNRKQGLLLGQEGQGHGRDRRGSGVGGATSMQVDGGDEHAGEVTVMASAAPKHEVVDAEEVAGLLQQLLERQ